MSAINDWLNSQILPFNDCSHFAISDICDISPLQPGAYYRVAVHPAPVMVFPSALTLPVYFVVPTVNAIS